MFRVLQFKQASPKNPTANLKKSARDNLRYFVHMASASASAPVGECSRKEVPQAAGSAKCGPGDSAASEQLNADFGTVAVEHASSMKWAPSPSPAVYRKRLELSGPKECGRVTSVVRYEPKSNFHEHGHPDGEEIFVLSGVFSDDSGDYPGKCHWMMLAERIHEILRRSCGLLSDK